MSEGLFTFGLTRTSIELADGGKKTPIYLSVSIL